jgi:hypothetical protein
MAFSANVDAALNQRRHDNYESMAFRNSPALGLMAHGDSDKMGGNAIKVTVKSAYSPGGGAVYATAYANKGETKRKAFLVTPFTLYALEDVDHDSDLYSRGDENAIIRVLGDAEESCTEFAAQQLDQALFSDGYGTLFTVLSHTGTTGTITLKATSPTDLFKIQEGQILVSKATPAAASLDTGTILVTKVDPIGNVLTGTAQSSYDATSVDGHVVGLNGTMQASTSLVTFPGYKAWLTNDSTALGASFFGVTRNTDVPGLAGHVIDCTDGTNIIDAINRVVNSISNYPKANPDLIFVNSSNMEKIQTQLDARRIDTESKGHDIDILYPGISFIGAHGKKLTVHAASACSAADVFVLDSGTWHFPSPGGKMIVPGQLDGTPFVPLIATDATMVKMKGTGFVYTDAPGFNGRAIVNP